MWNRMFLVKRLLDHLSSKSNLLAEWKICFALNSNKSHFLLFGLVWVNSLSYWPGDKPEPGQVLVKPPLVLINCIFPEKMSKSGNKIYFSKWGWMDSWNWKRKRGGMKTLKCQMNGSPKPQESPGHPFWSWWSLAWGNDRHGLPTKVIPSHLGATYSRVRKFRWLERDFLRSFVKFSFTAERDFLKRWQHKFHKSGHGST